MHALHLSIIYKSALLALGGETTQPMKAIKGSFSSSHKLTWEVKYIISRT